MPYDVVAMRLVGVAALVLTVLFSAPSIAGSAATRLISGPAATRVIPCHAEVRTGVLPTWARSGFSGPRPRIPHILGSSGEIVAILFGYPLYAPPLPRRNNKILWVSRHPHSRASLWIRAQLMDQSRPVGAPIRRIVPGGPGPSFVDLPSPGCWRLTLSWSGRRDSLDLEYRVPPGG